MATTTLQAELKSSLILDKGTGDPSFTRATSATVFDNEGKLITVPSGVARFEGARLVVNSIINSTSISTGWDSDSAVTLTGGQSDPESGTEGINVEATGVSTNYWTLADGDGLLLTLDDIASVTIALKYIDHPWYNVSCVDDNEAFAAGAWINAQTGTVGTLRSIDTSFVDTVVITNHPLDSDWKVVKFSFKMTNAAELNKTLNILIRPQDGDDSITEVGVQGTSVDIFGPQIEVVSGQLDTTPSEYIRTGQTAPFFGAGGDGAKWFSTNKDGSAISSVDTKGLLIESAAATNSILHCKDLTNVVWVKTNCTAALDQIGIDNIDNSASLLTATSGNATCIQTITLASASRSFSAYVQRSAGTGTIEITRDGGSSWTDITNEINSNTLTRVSIKDTSVLNPDVGFRIVTSGDSIIVDYCQDEAGAKTSSPIRTTTTAVTRNADQLTYQTTSNFSDTEGAIAISVENDDWANITGNIGSATTGLASSTANEGVQALDGTNTVNGPTGTPVAKERLAIGWETTNLKASSGGVLGTAGSYDGSFNLTNISVGIDGLLTCLYIYTTALTDSELAAASSLAVDSIFDNDAAMAFWEARGFTGSYNDRQLAYLRQFFAVTYSGNADLLARYIKENGRLLI